MNLKKIISLTMLLSSIMMIYTGVVLFIAPHGKIAYWANWKIFGLTKGQYSDLHSTFMIIFIVATILHVSYNFKPIVNYLSNQSKKVVILTKEMTIALLITAVFVVGTLYKTLPFSNFLSLGENAKAYWTDVYGEPPYNRAESSSLKVFIKRTSLNEEEALAALKENSIVYDNLEEKLIDIAKNNNKSPKEIYEIME